MILGPAKLLELVHKKKLVEGLSDRELTNPEGAGFDLRLGVVDYFFFSSCAYNVIEINFL